MGFMYHFTKVTKSSRFNEQLSYVNEYFKSNGNVSCRNCSIHGLPKRRGTLMVLENDSLFCLHCYRILEQIAN